MFQNNPLAYWLTYRLGFQPALTQTTEAEQQCLTRHATNRRRLVEIGVWHGVNTRRLRDVVRDDATVFAVDPFPSGKFGRSWQKGIAHREASLGKNGTLVWLEDFSHQAFEIYVKKFGDVVDFVFIDGDHSYEGVKCDWQLWSPLVQVGGCVALHDSRSYPGRQIDHCGAARFTREVISAASEFKKVDEVDSLTVVQRVSSR